MDPWPRRTPTPRIPILLLLLLLLLQVPMPSNKRMMAPWRMLQCLNMLSLLMGLPNRLVLLLLLLQRMGIPILLW
jgi:hypothetical protein